MVRTKQGALVDYGGGADGEVLMPKQFARKSTGGVAAREKLLTSKSAKKSSSSKDKGRFFVPFQQLRCLFCYLLYRSKCQERPALPPWYGRSPRNPPLSEIHRASD